MKKLKEFFPYILLILYIILATTLGFCVYDRWTWWAENIPVMIVVLVLILSFKSFRFSNIAYFLMWVFLSYHTIGWHYSFALVPFDLGNHLLSRLHMNFLFPDGRNNFDRLGHFMVWVFAYPVAEICYKKKWVNNIWAAIFMWIFALWFWWALYEIIETIYAIVAWGEAGANFLWSQWDIWDAQKDMLLDILWAWLVSVLFYFNFKKQS